MHGNARRRWTSLHYPADCPPDRPPVRQPAQLAIPPPSWTHLRHNAKTKLSVYRKFVYSVWRFPTKHRTNEAEPARLRPRRFLVRMPARLTTVPPPLSPSSSPDFGETQIALTSACHPVPGVFVSVRLISSPINNSSTQPSVFTPGRRSDRVCSH